MVGALAGFVAGTHRRGLAWAQVPTTLLGQIDASVGGKVAIDHPRAKNLIGLFHQPALVWCDVQTLDSLPGRDLASGLAEALKNGLLGDARHYSFCRRQHAELLARDSGALLRLVAGSCRIKAAVVAGDERQDAEPAAACPRMVLNLGHTLGNNLEAVAGYGTLRHGEAVAVGLVAAGRLALRRGLWSARWQRQLEGALAGLGLPTRIPGLPLADRLAAIRGDQKTVGGATHCILPVRPGTVTVAEVLLAMGAAAS